MAPDRAARTTMGGSAARIPDGLLSAVPMTGTGWTGMVSITRRPASATSAATATGRSEWVNRSR
jgi:hypothetical protein